MVLHRRLLPLLGALLFTLAALCLGPAVSATRTFAAAALAPASCGEVIQNGGFETNSAWQLGVSPAPPQYITSAQHSGSRALQLGIIGGPNRLSFSSVRQTVTIPADATQAQLSFWFYAVATGAPGTDYMELALLAPDGYTILDKPWYAENDSRSWNQLFFDLSRWRGQTLQVYFNVFNDGNGGTAGMLLDDVSLIVCSDGTATFTPTPTATGATATPTTTPSPSPIYITASPTTTPTPSPSPIYVTASPTPNYVVVTDTPTPTPNYMVVTNTPTPTPNYIVATNTPTPGVVYATATPTYAILVTGVPVPPNCVDLLQNGGFEQGEAGWWVAPNKIMPQLVTNPVHGGVYAMQLGSNTENLNSYSSVRQQVTLPYGYSALNLDFWAWTWADNAGGTDHQEAVLLQPDPAIIKKVWRGLFNERTWVQHVIPVIQYAGRTVVVYFDVVNDGAGGLSGMYLDDVHLWACGQYGQIQPISGGQSVVVVTQIVTVQVPVTVTVTAPILPPGAAAPMAGGAAAAGATVNALDLTATLIPTLTATPAPGALVQPKVTPAPSWFRQFWASVQSNLPGPWFIGFIIVVLAILGVIWLLSTRSNGLTP
jgi:hypothetical protein